jgi:hypothetical protein
MDVGIVELRSGGYVLSHFMMHAAAYYMNPSAPAVLLSSANSVLKLLLLPPLPHL